MNKYTKEYNYVPFKEKRIDYLDEIQVSTGVLYSYLLKLATLVQNHILCRTRKALLFWRLSPSSGPCYWLGVFSPTTWG